MGTDKSFFQEKAYENVLYSYHTGHLQIFMLGKLGLLMDINELCGNSETKLCSMVNSLAWKVLHYNLVKQQIY